MKWLIKLIRSLFKPKDKPIALETPINPPQTGNNTPAIPPENSEVLKPGAHGIDISHHNGNVDFNLIEQDFIFMKATEGSSFVSPVHAKRMKQAIDLGFPCSSYHYYKPGIDPIVQAKHFCKHSLGDLPPVLDIEDAYSNREKLIADLQKFLDYVEEAHSQIPIIYTGYSYIKDMKLPESFSRYPLWLAWYTTPDKVKAPAPWKEWTFWQYSETAQVKGVGKCDVNWYKAK